MCRRPGTFIVNVILDPRGFGKKKTECPPIDVANSLKNSQPLSWMKEASETRSFPLKIGFLRVSFFLRRYQLSFIFMHCLLCWMMRSVLKEHSYFYAPLGLTRYFFKFFYFRTMNISHVAGRPIFSLLFWPNFIEDFSESSKARFRVLIIYRFLYVPYIKIYK